MNREPIYYINEEKGIVVCELTDCSFDAVTLVQQKTDIFDELCPCCVPEELAISNSFKAIAKVHEGDIFDVEFGKKLAFKKAIVKRNIAINKRVKFIVKSYRNAIQNVFNSLDNLIILTNKRTESSTLNLEEVFKEAR